MAFRVGRTSEDLKRELTDIIRYVKDPRVSSILTIIKVELSNDLSHCKVYISSLEGMEKAKEWAAHAGRIAPTLVGGSKKHGGPDLGPTRARNAWAELGVDGRGIANEAPAAGFEGMPRLTSRMMARIQGFPDTWTFGKRKTVACRMIGNAFPPPVAQAVGEKIKECLEYGCADCKCEISLSQAVI